MPAATQAIVAQAIVLAATLGLLWRLYAIAFASRDELRCARCPSPGPSTGTELPSGARRPSALRVLSPSQAPFEGGRVRGQ
jgi:hypothetical protein